MEKGPKGKSQAGWSQAYEDGYNKIDWGAKEKKQDTFDDQAQAKIDSWKNGTDDWKSINVEPTENSSSLNNWGTPAAQANQAAWENQQDIPKKGETVQDEEPVLELGYTPVLELGYTENLTPLNRDEDFANLSLEELDAKRKEAFAEGKDFAYYNELYIQKKSNTPNSDLGKKTIEDSSANKTWYYDLKPSVNKVVKKAEIESVVKSDTEPAKKSIEAYKLTPEDSHEDFINAAKQYYEDNPAMLNPDLSLEEQIESRAELYKTHAERRVKNADKNKEATEAAIMRSESHKKPGIFEKAKNYFNENKKKMIALGVLALSAAAFFAGKSNVEQPKDNDTDPDTEMQFKLDGERVKGRQDSEEDADAEKKAAAEAENAEKEKVVEGYDASKDGFFDTNKTSAYDMSGGFDTSKGVDVAFSEFKQDSKDTPEMAAQLLAELGIIDGSEMNSVADRMMSDAGYNEEMKAKIEEGMNNKVLSKNIDKDLPYTYNSLYTANADGSRTITYSYDVTAAREAKTLELGIDLDGDGTIDKYSEFSSICGQLIWRHVQEGPTWLYNYEETSASVVESTPPVVTPEAPTRETETPPTNPEEPEKPPVTPEEPEKPPVTPEEPEKPPVTPEEPEKPPVTPEEPGKDPTQDINVNDNLNEEAQDTGGNHQVDTGEESTAQDEQQTIDQDNGQATPPPVENIPSDSNESNTVEEGSVTDTTGENHEENVEIADDTEIVDQENDQNIDNPF